MVNFKASGHAGEHKRALAAQTTEHKAVSKAETLAWSQQEGMLAAVPAVTSGAVCYGRFVRRISKAYQKALADAGGMLARLVQHRVPSQ